MTSRSALSFLGAFWFAACSFPDYAFVPDPEPEPEPDPLVSVCTDGLPSDAETGIDCGGGCSPCGMGETCRVHGDCESSACVNATCQVPACDDGVVNGAEADTDCGGQCDPCPPGRDCRAHEDCAEGVCSEGFCQPPSCNDTVLNGDESAADCGGQCTPCALGLKCNSNADCASVHCSGEVCVSPGCTDGALNGEETDIDCGGPGCGPCQADQECELDDDCISLICDEEDDVCTAVSCDDQVLNGDESALDCGGTNCPGCPNLIACNTGDDCASTACQSGLCVPAAPTGAALSRMGFTATASNSYVDDDPNEVLDSVGNRWTSGTDMYDGMWLEVDMGQLRTFFSVVLLCEEIPEDFPAKFDVYFSSDGTYGEPARAGVFGGTTSEVSFDTAQIARYIRIVIRQPSTNWWSIDQLNVYE